jgi:hypothetical protein
MLGSERHWTGAEPGVLYRLLFDGFDKPSAAVANPLIVLDEIDKAPASRSGHYRPRDALIPLLEPSTANSLRDKCSEVTFNARHVIYVATANALSTIDAPMQSRFDIQLVRDLTPIQAVGVVRAMHDNIRSELRLTGFGRPAHDLVQELALLANPRLVGRLLRRAFAQATLSRGLHRNALRLADLGGPASRALLH